MRAYELMNNYLDTRNNYSLQKIHPVPQKYPEDIQCVLISKDHSKGSIYISNVEAAENPSTLNKYKITAVMTCARGYDRNISKSRLEMYEYFPFDDKESCIISPYFDKGADFISKALEKTNILVHCIAGVSRSVSMVLAFFIREKGMSYEEAYNHVKSHRKIIHPNDGFIKQLKKFAVEVSERKKKSLKSSEIKERVETYTPTKRSSYQGEDDRHFQTIQHAKTSDFGKNIVRNEIMNGEEMTADVNYGKNYSFLLHNPKQPLKNKNEYHLQSNTKNNQTHMIKSSTFINDSKSKTPEKAEKKERKMEIIEPYVFGERTQYFKKLNEELNDKIEAIHQKYNNQREELMSKREKASLTNQSNMETPTRPETHPNNTHTKEKSYSFENSETPRAYGNNRAHFQTEKNLRYLPEKSFSFSNNQNLRLLRENRSSPFQESSNNNFRYKGYSPYEKNQIKYGGYEDHYSRKFKYAEMNGIGKLHDFGIFGRGVY